MGEEKITWTITKKYVNVGTKENPEWLPLNEWISVNTRLPEINQTVICLYNSSYEYKDNVIVCTYCGDDIWEDYYGCTTTEKITHWMFLPSPPIDK